MAHKHNITPVDDSTGSYRALSVDQPFVWNGPLTALGKINNVALTGSFLLQFEFEEIELSNWLETYARANPEAALRLIGKIQPEAIIALSQQSPPN